MTTIKSSVPGHWATRHIATSLATAEADERQDEQRANRWLLILVVAPVFPVMVALGIRWLL